MISKKRTFVITIAIGFLLLFGITLTTPEKIFSTGSAIKIVNSIADSDDGACDSTNCTLREAIHYASTGDTINFDSSILGNTISLSIGQLTIDKNLAIRNKSLTQNITISAATSSRIFQVSSGKSLTLDNLILQDGAITGGVVENNSGDVTVNGCHLESNGSTNAAGGALKNDLGTMVVNQSTFLNNTAQNGGAIWNTGDLTVNDSTFKTNQARNYGGAIYNGTNAEGLNVNNSTFTGNTTTDYDGGAIHTEADSVYITNSTFYYNSAGFRGGGICGQTLSVIEITNCTFSENDGAVTGTGGGGLHIMGGLYMYNTIIANSTGGYDCYWNSLGVPVSIRNLIMNNAPSSNACGTPYLTGGPALGPLADNGGYTETMALLSSSPAIDVGHPDHCPLSDQRGFPRPQGVGCDLGAYELDSYPFVISIETADPNPTDEDYVDFTVTFNEAVNGISKTDFILTTTGTIIHDSVYDIKGVDEVYAVKIQTGTGTGTIRLDLIDYDTIVDDTSNYLGGSGIGNGDFDEGEVYFLRYHFIYLPLILK